MLIKDTIPFVDNTAALPQSADTHLEQQGISTTMTNRQRLHDHNIYIPPRCSCSAGHNASIAYLLSNNEILHIVGDINAHQSRWNANTNENERSEQPAVEIDTAYNTIPNGATRLPTNGRSTSLDKIWPPMTSHYYQTGQFPPHWPAIICSSSSPSTANCPRFMGLGEPTSTSLHHMSLTFCIKSHCTPATLAPAHTPCLFSIDLHTVRQHLVIVHFLLLLLLPGTLFQMMSGVPHHSHHLSLV